MKQILLTNEDFVRSITLIDNNVQSKFLLSAIREAQEVGLQEIIGTSMMNKLKSLVDDGSINEENNIYYKSLLDEAQLYIAYAAVANLCLITNVKISNGGLQQTSDENLTVLNLNDTFTFQKHLQDKADFFAKRLQGYILNNIKNLPEIDDNKCNEISLFSNDKILISIKNKILNKLNDNLMNHLKSVPGAKDQI